MKNTKKKLKKGEAPAPVPSSKEEIEATVKQQRRREQAEAIQKANQAEQANRQECFAKIQAVLNEYGYTLEVVNNVAIVPVRR